MRADRPGASAWRLGAALTVLAACSSGGDGGTDPTGSFTISVSPAAISVVQGGTGQATVTLTRVDGFAGTVNFTVQGAPAGVTGSVSGGGAGTVSTGTVTITVGAAVPTGTYNLTLRAAASGLADRTAAFSLTVTASGGFTIGTTLPTLSVAQGAGGTATVTLTRTGAFAGAVALAVSGVPAGVTATWDPASIAAGSTTADLDVTVGAAVAPGNYPLVITGTAAGLPNATANLTLSVVAGTGSFTIAASPAVLEIQQGSTGQTTITVTRSGGFTGPVSLALTGTSAGITASFQPAVVPAGSTTSVVTITIPPVAPAPAPARGERGGAFTPVGDYPLVFTGTAEGLPNATATVNVGVSPAPGGSFTMQVAPTSGSVQAGNSTQSTLTITRTLPFVGGVGFTVTGVPASATVTFSPVAITAGGTTTQVTFSTSTAVVPGIYPIQITGIGDGVNVPNAGTTFTLTVTAPPGGGGNATWQFCDPAFAPLWFAYQDGINSGPWTVVAPTGNSTYNFTLGGSGGVAWVEPDGAGGFATRVLYSSQAGLVALGNAQCAATPPSKTVTGSVAGLGATDNALIGLGTAGSAANFALPNFTIRKVPPGNRTLIAARSTLNLGTLLYEANKVVIRRNQNIPDGGVIPVINFGTEGFAPVVQPLTLNNVLGWAPFAAVQYFTDNGGSSGSLVANNSGAGYPSIPAAQQVAGDLHFVTATAVPDLMDASQFRSVGRFFYTAVAQNLTFGPILAPTTVTGVGGASYVRLQVSGTVQNEYNRLLTFNYSQTGRSASIQVTGAPFVTGGDTNFSVAFPNFTGLPGWQDGWMPNPQSAVTWQVSLQGWDGNGTLGGLPVEGERVLTAGRGGQYQVN